MRSGIQTPDGGVARYYRLDLSRNHAVSTEITGYAASTFVFLENVCDTVSAFPAEPRRVLAPSDASVGPSQSQSSDARWDRLQLVAGRAPGICGTTSSPTSVKSQVSDATGGRSERPATEVPGEFHPGLSLDAADTSVLATPELRKGAADGCRIERPATDVSAEFGGEMSLGAADTRVGATPELPGGMLERARAAAGFLMGAWDAGSGAMPFEVSPAQFTYFFDCGIIVRGLLAVWRAAGDAECLDFARMVGDSMARDFRAASGEFHPILTLPGKRPMERDPLRWSRSPGCYQLKSAMAWWDLWEATGDVCYRELYEGLREESLRSAPDFLPGHADPRKVVDRLHAYLYFLEALLPRLARRLAKGLSA